ncbi:MAG: cyclic nucleotide-binding domain-containing protein [Syntrophales bacterium]|nr:cyclic nucleotide-binding domain-containing protein [Syntrophales bacterium]
MNSSFGKGELGSHLSVLTAGMAEVHVHVHAEGGTVVTVATFRPGDRFGEMSLLTGDAASADVVAIEESETLRLNRGDFNALVAAHPSLLRELVR